MKQSYSAWGFLLLNLLLLAGQAGFGKQASLVQREMGMMYFWANPFYLLTMACLGLQVMVWPLVLRRFSLGFAYGFNALSLVTTLLISWGIYGETVTWSNVAGCGLIVGGVRLWAAGMNAREAV